MEFIFQIQVLLVVLQVIGVHTVVPALLMEHSIEGSAQLIIHLILKHQLARITIIGNIVQASIIPTKKCTCKSLFN